jgi:DNA-binding response OmpR family regulator
MTIHFGLAGASVLVVEDDPLLALTLAAVLEHESAAVVGPYASHDAAMGVVASRLPSLALLDVNIEGGTSFALAKWLGDRHVPFAFITGEPLDAIPFALSHMGYLRKPASSIDVRSLATRLWAAAHH